MYIFFCQTFDVAGATSFVFRSKKTCCLYILLSWAFLTLCKVSGIVVEMIRVAGDICATMQICDLAITITVVRVISKFNSIIQASSNMIGQGS